MKRLLAAVLVLAGCASKPPQERPLPPGMVTVATFTAEADPVARTFTIRTEPTAAGRAQGMAALVASEVLLENDGAPWFTGPSSECPDEENTWGARVKVTSLVLGDIWLGGVYAEITSFGGDSGNVGCNGLLPAEAPDGLLADYGLWAYPTIGPLAAEAQTVPWVFGLANTTAFSFGGRIVAAKMGVTIDLDPVFEGDQVIADVGTSMVYSSSNFDRLQFANYDGTDAGHSLALNGRATSISADVGEGVIWVTTEYNDVGFATIDQTGQGFVNGQGALLGGIVLDPTVGGRAWFRSNEDKFIRTIDRATLQLGDIIDTSPNAPWGMAMGPDGFLYVTAPSENRIMVFETGASGGTPVIEFDAGSECEWPTSIMQGPDGRMWFSAWDSSAVCSFDPIYDSLVAPVPTPVNTASGPMQLAIGPDGNAWVAAFNSDQVSRMDAIGPGYRITLLNDPGPFGLASGGGKLWAADVYGIYPIELDPLTP